MEDLKSQIIKHNFSFKKSLGQNFLTDTNLLDSIVNLAGVDENTTVLEIGLGAGALTKALAKKAKKVYGYEIDRSLKPVLDENLSGLDNIEITYLDIMKEKLDLLEKKVGDDYFVVANLPYYITTPILMNFIEKAKKVKSLTIMVQEEVAKRLVSKENTEDYGAITVSIGSVANAKIIKRVPKEMFTPRPKVDSAVVRIDMDREKFGSFNKEVLRDTIRCAFNNRRKTLSNNLMNYFKFSREVADGILQKAGIEKEKRGETLSVEKFIELSKVIEEVKG
ncbi:MAG: ribosomal RNA small subunit methyltransferase A [Clostridiales bacterium]|nr:ribosomal RNA small subunit methyltransferase A [Clostridiales bacterium]